MMGRIKGDTRSVDYNSFGHVGLKAQGLALLVAEPSMVMLFF